MELEPAEQRVILVGRNLEDGFYVERIEVSGMNIAVYYRAGTRVGSWCGPPIRTASGPELPMGMMTRARRDG